MAYTVTYMAVNLMMQNYLYGRFRWPWISELYEYIQSVYLLPAVLSVMANPRKPTFKVTAKNESLDESRISELGRPFFVIFAILVAAVGVTVWKIIAEPYHADVTLVVGLWNILNLIIAGLRARRRLRAAEPAPAQAHRRRAVVQGAGARAERPGGDRERVGQRRRHPPDGRLARPRGRARPPN